MPRKEPVKKQICEHPSHISALRLADIRVRILADYERINDLLETILEKPSKNNIVRDRDYLNPTIMLQSVPLSDPNGKYQYCLKIRAALESALTTGRIPRKLAPPRAPIYISDLVI